MHFLIALMLPLAPAPQGTAQTAPPKPAEAPVVSLDRIRRALEEEPPATVTVASTDPTLPPVFRLDIRQRPLPYEHLWKGDYASAHIRPVRGLIHHEFLEQVTPELFRATTLYPCCNVLPLLKALGSKLGSKGEGESTARAEVKKALKEFQDAARAAKKPEPPPD